MDRKRYPANEFKRLYHLRWGVEECFKRLKYHQEIEHMSGKSVPVVLQDFYAGILAGNLTTALAVAGRRQLQAQQQKSYLASAKTYQINLAQAFAKMKQYQARLWRLEGGRLGQYLKDLILLLMKFKEQVRPDWQFSRKNTQCKASPLDALQMHFVIKDFGLTYRHWGRAGLSGKNCRVSFIS